jgi:hypothetical protein
MTKTKIAEFVLWAAVAVVFAWAVRIAWDEGVLQKGFDETRQAPVVAVRQR